MKVLIIGTGYVGMNTGVVLAYLGNHVTCLDVNEEKIALLRQGKSPVYEPHLEETLQLVSDNITFTSSYAEADIPNTDVIFITVGTPSLPDGNADLRYVRQAAEAIAENLDDKFTVIVNKSTVPIGSGNWVEAIMHEHFESNHNNGEKADFNVVSSPEFLAQGSAMHDSFYPDRIVVGSQCERSVKRLQELFGPIMRQDFTPPPGLPRPAGLTEVPLLACDLTSAEMIKYAANAFLALKISYVNEIGRLANKVGADIQAVSKGIGLDKRIGHRFLNAGLGWGGSCFGKDTAALVATARDYRLEMPIIESAREVNYSQRVMAVDLLQDQLKILKGKHIALLGFSFKPNTDDLRDAPAIDISRLLIQRGALVRAHDPVALGNARRQYGDMGVIFCDQVGEALKDVQGIMLVTEWPEYRQLDWESIPRVPIVDGRNFLDRERLEGLGFPVIGIGR
ncbi:MAG: UDP-glucose/GDP-mannose dehydrogenase family protein [Anaerolineaceae bacterium]|nr:UDP-glucose/GDP-mannose dehydrogenase family protein [Anaerolineaceae bacterium]MDD4042500.1 UDP-glucose/GDP-mannose dehydrogenase family protein [Anaerolineaceae bacterium]